MRYRLDSSQVVSIREGKEGRKTHGLGGIRMGRMWRQQKAGLEAG